MDKIHEQNISYLKNLFQKEKFIWINYNEPIKIDYFKSGGGTHLYLIQNANKKYLVRINFYPKKNEWGVKKQEYDVLKLIEPLNISPKVFYFSNNNPLNQDFTIVEYIEGQVINEISEQNIIDLAVDLKKLHLSFPFDKTGDTLPPQEKLPYHCDIYDTFANGEDKQIERYSSLKDISKIVEPYNRIKEKLEKWFNNLKIFDNCTQFCLCHADLKKENILVIREGIKLIDWECAGSDIAETDIGQLFSGLDLSQRQQELFLKNYYGNIPEKIILERIDSIKLVLDFFCIIEDYIILKRKKWSAEEMLSKLLIFEKKM